MRLGKEEYAAEGRLEKMDHSASKRTSESIPRMPDVNTILKSSLSAQS